MSNDPTWFPPRDGQEEKLRSMRHALLGPSVYLGRVCGSVMAGLVCRCLGSCVRVSPAAGIQGTPRRTSTGARCAAGDTPDPLTPNEPAEQNANGASKLRRSRPSSRATPTTTGSPCRRTPELGAQVRCLLQRSESSHSHLGDGEM